MKTSKIWDHNLRQPVNRTAHEVSKPGIGYIPKKRLNQPLWKSPPSMMSVPTNIQNLTGVVFSRFTVIGLKSCGKGKTLWLVRCACGNYETRRSKSIQNPNNDKDCCQICRHLEFLKREQRYREVGIDIDAS